MGGWTAFFLQQQGAKVTLIDSWGGGNSRASSGGETRVIRSGYGKDSLYTAWSRRALMYWKHYQTVWGKELFLQTGVLWLAAEEGGYESDCLAEMNRQKIPVERLPLSEMTARYPQISTEGLSFALFEPESGVLMARRSCQIVTEEVVRSGGRFELQTVKPGDAKRGRLENLLAVDGSKIKADKFVFACGPWLPQMFPEILSNRIRVTKQDVIFYGTPRGDNRFTAPHLPTWIEMSRPIYGVPSVDGRGFKVAPHLSGPEFDPTNGMRMASPESIEMTRKYLAIRFPALKDQPVVETRTCQYESTPNEHFVIDRHPELENVWILGGGSGHSFKMGPALGEYAAEHIAGRSKEPVAERFRLSPLNRTEESA